MELIILAAIAYAVYRFVTRSKSTTTSEETTVPISSVRRAAAALKDGIAPVAGQVKTAVVDTKAEFVKAQEEAQLVRLLELTAKRPDLVAKLVAAEATEQLSPEA
jgi:hypothetical protein